MKSRFAILFLLLALLVPLAKADSAFFGSLTNATGTNYSTIVPVGVALLPPSTFYVTYGTITNTNVLAVDMQFSVGDTNSFVTAATFYPSATNAQTATYTPALYATTVYLRARVRVTTATPVSVISK